MMFGRKTCFECGKDATLEITGRVYCSSHALEVVRKTNYVPPVKILR